MTGSLKTRQSDLRDRLAHARRPKKGNGDQQKQLDRINELTRAAKGTWYGLIGYMAFVGVILMGAQDVDFFVLDHQTPLPLVNVPVSTKLFMYMAPYLGVLMYANFHLYLLKLREALTTVDSTIDGMPLSEHITPWVVSDFALPCRKAGALRHRPFRHIVNAVSGSIAYVGTPSILAWIWYRSAVLHPEFLGSIAYSVPFILSAFIGVVSWQRFIDLDEHPTFPLRLLTGGRWVLFIVFTLSITVFGWWRIEGTFVRFAMNLGLEEGDVKRIKRREMLVSSADLRGIDFAKFAPLDFRNIDFRNANLRAANMQGVDLKEAQLQGATSSEPACRG